MQYKEQQGFLTIAQNSPTVDYLRLAYVQALSVKLVMPTARYAVLVDANTLLSVTDQHRKVFDYVILIENDYAIDEEWKLSNEWQVGNLTPFKETIKLESDILITRSIEHWWHTFRLRDVVLSTGCRDYQQRIATSRAYRKVFDGNHLPDVYNGLMYFRFSRTSTQFFKIARHIYSNWATARSALVGCDDPAPTTDLVYALAASILGVEKCTLPSIDFINFVHLKSEINGWPSGDWHEMVNYELDLPLVRINNINQYHPVHYHEKDWMTDDIIKEYEHAFFR